MKDIEISAGVLIVVAGLIGMWVHFLIAKRDKRVAGNFISYLLADNPKGTGVTLFALFVSIGGLYSMGTFDDLDMDKVIAGLQTGVLIAPLLKSIAAATTAGYVCDSMLNKGSPQ